MDLEDSEEWRHWASLSIVLVSHTVIEDLGLVVSTIQNLTGDSDSFVLPTHETAIFLDGEIIDHYDSYDKAKGGHIERLLKIESIKTIKFEGMPLLINDKDILIKSICRKRLYE